MDEPVADMLRGVLDGHIVMSRDIAEAGRFPAIDVLRSVSRSLPKAATDAENQLIAEAREVLGTYAKSELMVRSGLYASGADANLDRAIKLQPDLERFLARSSDNPNSAFADLRQILRKR
jgi:flagellum-specific ATP synthase